MNKYTIITTNTFRYELKNIYHYIYHILKEPLLAHIFFETVVREISSLDYMPERFMKILNKNRNRNLRRLPIDKYVVIYEVDNNTRSSLHFTHLSW